MPLPDNISTFMPLFTSNARARSVAPASAYVVSISQHTSAYGSIRQHTSAYVSIRPTREPGLSRLRFMLYMGRARDALTCFTCFTCSFTDSFTCALLLRRAPKHEQKKKPVEGMGVG
jgi:hypothetical protein